MSGVYLRYRAGWAALTLGAVVATSAKAADTPLYQPTPDWVLQTPLRTGKETVPAAQANAPIAFLSNELQVRFSTDFDERYASTEIKILTPQGLAAVGTIALPWNPDSSVLTVHKLKIVRGATIIDVLGSGQKFTVLRRERNLEQQTLDGVLTATIQPEGLQVGDVLQLAYTVRMQDPVTKGHAEVVAGGFDGLPGTPVRFRALWPKGKPVQWRATPGLPAPKITERADGSELLVALEGGEKLQPPEDAPARYNPTRFVMMSDFGGWAGVSKMMAPLYTKASVIKPGSALANEVAKIKAASSDPAKQAFLALKLTEDRVRYVYRGMDAGNLTPADAEATWERRFGDCKGKTALLIALLRALNISAEPALVSTQFGDGLDQRLPLISMFDHVIVRTEIAGRTYWLDGTRMGDVALDAIPVPAFHWALPVRDAGADLVALKVEPPRLPLIETVIEFDASRGLETPASAEIKTVHRGDAALALKVTLAQLSPTDLDKTLRDYWKKEYSFIEPEKVGARFDEATGEEHLTLSGKARLDFTGGYELDGARIGWENKLERKGPNADAPVAVAYPYWTRVRESIFLPKGGKGFAISGKDVTETRGGYSFSRKTTLTGDTLVMEANVRSMAPEITLAQARADEAALTAMSKVSVRLARPEDYSWTSSDVESMKASKPETAAAFLRRGNMYLDNGDSAEALADFESAVKLEGDNALAIINRGQAKIALGQLDGVGAEFDRAEKINPREVVLFHGRAQLAEANGDYPAAIAALSRAIEIWPRDRWALAERAYLNRVVGSATDALADVERLVDMSPDRARWMRYETLAAAGKYADGLALVTEAGKSSPKDMSLKVQRAKFLQLSGDAAGARAIFAEIRSGAKGEASMLNGLCWAQAQANFDLAAALGDCQAALKLSKDSAAALDSLALVYHRMGRNADAVRTYDQALAKAPKQTMSLYGRGLAKLAMGDASGAADLKTARQNSRLIEIAYLAMGLGKKPLSEAAAPGAAK